MSSHYEVFDPATLEVVAQVPENTAEDTRQAALRARAALRVGGVTVGRALRRW